MGSDFYHSAAAGTFLKTAGRCLGFEAEPCSGFFCRLWSRHGVSCPGEGSARFQPGRGNFTPCPVSADVEELWIGLNDLKLQMNFEWSDGTPVRFTYWHPFEPNNFRDSLEDCVTIWGPVRARGRGFILHLPKVLQHAGRVVQRGGR